MLYLKINEIVRVCACRSGHRLSNVVDGRPKRLLLRTLRGRAVRAERVAVRRRRRWRRRVDCGRCWPEAGVREKRGAARGRVRVHRLLWPDGFVQPTGRRRVAAVRRVGVPDGCGGGHVDGETRFNELTILLLLYLKKKKKTVNVTKRLYDCVIVINVIIEGKNRK